MDSLADQILGLRPDPDAIGAATAVLLRCLKEDDAAVGVDDLAAYFVEETTRMGLDWMGAGARDEIQALLDRLHEACRAEGAGHPPLSALPASERLEARLRELTRVLELYLRLDNVVRYTAELSGARRANWRRLLAWVDEDDRTVRTADVVEAGLYDRRNSAHDALEALAERGYLERREEGAGVAYRLTWSGRTACAVVLSEEDSPEPVEADELVEANELMEADTPEPVEAEETSRAPARHTVAAAVAETTVPAQRGYAAEAPPMATSGVALGRDYRARLASYQRGVHVKTHGGREAASRRPFRVAVLDFPNGRLLRFAWMRQHEAVSALARPVEVHVVRPGTGLFEKLGQGRVDAVLGNLEATALRLDHEHLRFIDHGLSLYRGSALLARAEDVGAGARFGVVPDALGDAEAEPYEVTEVRRRLDGCRVLATGTTGHERSFRKLVAGIDYDVQPELVEAPDRVEGIRQFLRGEADAYLGGVSERFLAEWLSEDGVVELLAEARTRLGLQEQNGLIVRSGVMSREGKEALDALSDAFFTTVEEIETERRTGGGVLIDGLLDEVNEIAFLAGVDGFHFGRAHFDRWWGGYEEFFSSREEARRKTLASIKANEQVIENLEPVLAEPDEPVY